MTKLKAAITGIEAYLPEYRLDNHELSRMVDTSDEWIMQRIGIRERPIEKDPNKASSDLGAEAVKKLLKKTNTSPDEIDVVVCATVTPDMQFPATANLIAAKAGINNAYGFDLGAACSGFLFALENVNGLISTGKYKKIILVAAEKMSSIVDYTDRATCPLFGDAAAACMIEPTEEEVGVMDSSLHVDGNGAEYLHLKSGGSLHPASIETVQNKEHYLYQEGQKVFKEAVSKMADVSVEMMERHNFTPEDIAYLVPHQANMRIIEATARRMGLDKDKVMINIDKYGNTTAATIPLCLWEWEEKLKKGDNIILAAFGGGFTWGAIYLKWAY